MKLPIMLEIEHKKILIIGGGNIGYRKAMTLKEFGADVTCLSLEFLESFKKTNVHCIKNAYDPSYLDGFHIVIGATDDEAVNGRIYEDSKKINALCMTVDSVNPSDFSFMAIRKKDNLIIGVSTEGGSPSYSKKMVEKLIETVSEDDIIQLEKMILERQERLKGR